MSTTASSLPEHAGTLRATRRARLLPGLSLVAILGLAASACGGASTTTTTAHRTTTTASAAQTKTAITTTWTTFFAYSTPSATRLAVLQDGSKYKSTIASLTHLFPPGTAATVKSVTVNGTTATVGYSLKAASGPLPLPASTGTAVEVNGKWLVSDSTFCGLITLAGASCPS